MVKSRVNLHCKDSYFPLKFTKDKPDLRWVLGNMFTVQSSKNTGHVMVTITDTKQQAHSS